MNNQKEHQGQKRKWQLALRRYLIEGNKSFAYARYFGISAGNFRNWIEAQFENGCTWENYTKNWQLDHIVPISYFDINNEADLKLAWSFINIRPALLVTSKETANKVDLSGAKKYFTTLSEQTGYILCIEMLDKIGQIENAQIIDTNKQIEMLNRWEFELGVMQGFDDYDFEKINSGVPIEKIVQEKEILKKRGL